VFGVVTSLLTAAVSAQDAPYTLLKSGTPAGGQLVGNSAGSFGCYEIAYPGDSAELHIEVSYWPADPVTSAAFGFNVYRADGWSGQGTAQTDAQGILELDYSEEEAATLLVQVYNYLPEAVVNYGVTVTGLPEVADAVASEETAAAVDTTAPVVNEPEDLGTSEAGLLVGNPAGSFELYEIAYPGDESTLTISLSYWPADPVVASAFGFNVYGSNGFEGKGVPTGNGDNGLLTLSYADDEATTLTVQVYNYTQGLPVSFLLER